jgi:hypothetical protein
MSKIERLVGAWSGSAEMVSSIPQEFAGLIPQGAEPGGRPSFPGGGNYEWVLDGMFLKGQGWHETGHGGRVSYVEYITWDRQAGKYRSWWFNNRGMFGEGWMTLDKDGSTLRVTAEAADPQGRKSRRQRTMTFIDDRTMEWTWLEDSPKGTIKLRGTHRRER